jgi:hypothetical protein
MYVLPGRRDTRLRVAWLWESVEEPGEGGAVAAGVGVDRGDVVGAGDAQVGDQAGAGAGEGVGEGGGDDGVGAALDQQDRNAQRRLVPELVELGVAEAGAPGQQRLREAD